MNSALIDQKRDYFRFEDALQAFIMPLDGLSVEPEEAYKAFSTYIGHPALSKAVRVRQACLDQAQTAKRLHQHAHSYLKLADQVLELANGLIEAELDKLRDLQCQVRELSEGGLAFESSAAFSVGQRVAVMLFDSQDSLLHLAVGEVRHCNERTNMVSIVGIELTQDVAEQKRWQQFVRTRQLRHRSASPSE
jgi:hypothetical protein